MKYQILQHLVIIIWFCRSVQHHYYDEMASFLKRVKRAVELLQRVSPLFGNIFSCFMKRCRGKFLEGTPAVTKKRSGYISIIQLSCVGITKGGGICWTFFSWVDLSNVVCTVYPSISTVYLIGLKEWRLFCYNTKFGSGKVYKCNSWGFIPA